MVAVSALATLTATSPSALAAARTPPATPSASPGVENPGHLDLGPADVLETRTISTPQPGVTLTQITRGTTDYALIWTVETLIPATGTSPAPGRSAPWPVRLGQRRCRGRPVAGEGLPGPRRGRGAAAGCGCAHKHPGLSGPGWFVPDEGGR